MYDCLFFEDKANSDFIESSQVFFLESIIPFQRECSVKFGIVLDDLAPFQIVLKSFTLFQNTLISSKLFWNTPECSKLFVRDKANFRNLVKNVKIQI